MSEHSPGPWRVIRRGLEVFEVAAGRSHVCDMPNSDQVPGHVIANAFLIAAAPDLLAVLKEVDERLRKCFGQPISAEEAYDSFYQEMVSEAITKAEVSA